jgi:DNA polymerase-3 subunit gamma/tau
MDAVGRVSPFTRSYLLEAHPVSFSNQLLTIGFDPQFADHLELVDNAKNRTLIQTKLKEAGYANAQVKLIKAEAPARQDSPAPEPPAPAPTATTSPPPPAAASTTVATRPTAAQPPVAFDKNEFKNDPLIRKALEIFKGQIADIRAS